MLINQRNLHTKNPTSALNSTREIHVYPIPILTDGRTSREKNGHFK